MLADVEAGCSAVECLQADVVLLNQLSTVVCFMNLGFSLMRRSFQR